MATDRYALRRTRRDELQVDDVLQDTEMGRGLQEAQALANLLRCAIPCGSLGLQADRLCRLLGELVRLEADDAQRHRERGELERAEAAIDRARNRHLGRLGPDRAWRPGP